MCIGTLMPSGVIDENLICWKHSRLMKKGLILIILALSIFATVFGCKDGLSCETFAKTTCTYEIPCSDNTAEHAGETNQHHECAFHCAHSFLATMSLIISPIEFTNDLSHSPYIFSYKNQNLDTLDRPPLKA